MAEQRWYGGLPVVGQRPLGDEELERLGNLATAIVREGLISYAAALACVILVAVVLVVRVPQTLFEFAGFALATAALRLLPQRRFHHPRTLMALRRDLRSRTVDIATMDDATLEVLSESHMLWTHDGWAVTAPMVVHATVTALPPEHAALAANFVRPVDDEGALLLHQRAMTADEREELESYAPLPQVALLVVAIVGLAGSVMALALASGKSGKALIPSVAFLLAGVIASVRIYRMYKERKLIANDLELGYVLIARERMDSGLGPPREFLPFSGIRWTEAGTPADWRRQLRKTRS